MSTIKKSLSLYALCAVLNMPSLAMEDEEDFFSSSPISVKRDVIGSEGAKALVSPRALTSLDLNSNAVGNEGRTPAEPILVLDKVSSHSKLDLSLTFNNLIDAKSVKTLSLKEAQLNETHFKELMNVLMRNQSLKRVDFTNASFNENTFSLLRGCLETQKTLQELILKPQFVITEKQVETFYESLKGNKALRLIVWPEDKNKKIEKKIKSLADKGNRVAALHRGVFLTKSSPDTKEAFTYLKKAYDEGHPLASYEIGKLKEKEKQLEEALKWHQISAQEGHSRALVKVGDYHRAIWPKGRQAEPNYQEAYKNYKSAAEQDNPKAFYRIGRMHEGGKYVEKSLDKAASFFNKAVEWGYADAFTALGALYHNPEYSGCNPERGKQYLEQGKLFTKTKPVAERILSYQ